MPPTGQSAARWSYVKLGKATVAVWHVARGSRGVFDGEWPLRPGFFWVGIGRSFAHASLEKAPFLLADMRTVCDKGAWAPAHLRFAIVGGTLPRDVSVLEPLMDDAPSPRETASMAVALASEVTRLAHGDAHLDGEEGVFQIKVERRKNDQFGVGQMAHLVTTDTWGCDVSREASLWFVAAARQVASA